MYERYSLITHLAPRVEPVVVDKQKLTSTTHIEGSRVDMDKVVVIPPDSTTLIAVKSLLKQHSVPKWRLEKFHIVPALLDPRQKKRLHLFGVPLESILNAKDELFSLMRRTMQTNSQSPPTISTPPPKRQKTASRACVVGAVELCGSDSDDSDDDEINTTLSAEQRELNMYWRAKLSQAERDNLNLLQWWCSMEKSTLPNLAKVARSILCIPASSAM